jgi:hypothetical protein
LDRQISSLDLDLRMVRQMIDARFEVLEKPDFSQYGHYGKDGNFVHTFDIASDIKLLLPEKKENSFWNGLSDYLFSGPPKDWRHVSPEDEYFHVFESIHDSAVSLLALGDYTLKSDIVPQKWGLTVDVTAPIALKAYFDKIPSKAAKDDFIMIVPAILRNLCLTKSATFVAYRGKSIEHVVIRPCIFSDTQSIP